MQKQIRGYEVIQKIGAGGMGEVYLAEDLFESRKVAIKVLSPQQSSNQKVVQEFCLEAELQAKLTHPNIIRLYSFIREKDFYAMILEYVDGITLYKLITGTGGIKEQRALGIFKQMLEGVRYLHSKGVLHRDINPRNFLVDLQDKVKIMDFGISKGFGESIEYAAREEGTLYYVPPEQFRGIEQLDQRADIYGLGITLYEMLTGRVPFSISFNEESDERIKREILTGRITDPREYQPSISDATVAMIFKLIERQREKRYSSVDEVLNALQPGAIQPKQTGAPSLVHSQQGTPVEMKQKIKTVSMVKVFRTEDELMKTPSGAISSLVFSTDGKMFACGDMRGKVKFYETETGHQLASFSAHHDGISSLCFSPDGKYLASASLDKTIYLWYMASNTVKTVLRGHTFPILSITFSANSKFLLSGSANNAIKIWDVESGKDLDTLQGKFTGKNDYLTTLSFSQDGTMVALASSDFIIHVLDLANKKEVATLKGHTTGIYSLTFSPDKKILSSGALDGVVKLWDIKTGTELMSFKRHTSAVYATSFSTNEKNLASGSTDNTIKIWDITNGMEVQTLKQHNHDISSLAFSPDGNYLASGDWGNTIIIWKVEYY